MPTKEQVKVDPARGAFPRLHRFQCGDKSHATYRPYPELEAQIRQRCNMPKVRLERTDSKGRKVTVIVHRLPEPKGLVDRLHHEACKSWVAKGNSLALKKPVTETEEMTRSERQKLEQDDWEVIEAADVDESGEERGKWSGMKAEALDDGLQ